MVRNGIWERNESQRLVKISDHAAFRGLFNIPVKGIKVRLGALPQRILPGIILRIDHSSVDPTIKVGENIRFDAVA